ncbi:MAG: type III polyketide synthase [Planctomycetota bacterium]
MAIICGLGTANPSRYVTQREVWDYFQSHATLSPAEKDLYRRVLLSGPIAGRHVAVEYDRTGELGPDELTDRFQRAATEMASSAGRQAMARAGLSGDELGGLVVNTCTGYLCPGLSSYVMESLELSGSVRLFDLAGMGCGGAIPNLECAAGLLARDDGQPVLSVAVEVCSATLMMGEDPGLVISNSIFGDGAAAAVLSPAPRNGRGVRLVDFATVVLPDGREELRYRTEGGRLRNVLTRRVPVLGARAMREVCDRLLSRHGLERADVSHWVVHPGGTAVLEQVRREMGLCEENLAASYGVFRDYGNMSSPSVLFVLDRLLGEASPTPGERAMLLAFGAGFTAFAALAELV